MRCDVCSPSLASKAKREQREAREQAKLERKAGKELYRSYPALQRKRGETEAQRAER